MKYYLDEIEVKVEQYDSTIEVKTDDFSVASFYDGQIIELQDDWNGNFIRMNKTELITVIKALTEIANRL